LVEGFLDGYPNASTRTSYGKVVRQTLAKLGVDPSDVARPDSLRPDALRRAVVQMGTSESTFRNRCSIVRQFVRWLGDQQVGSSALVRAVDVGGAGLGLAPPAPQPPPLSREQFDNLVARPGVAAREKAYWHLIRDTSATPTGVLRLTVREVDLGRRRCVVVERGEPRRPMFTVVTADLLAVIIEDRREGPVFRSRRGGVLGYRRAAEIISELTAGTVTLQQLRARPTAGR
jgi:hypothetical protein